MRKAVRMQILDLLSNIVDGVQYVHGSAKQDAEAVLQDCCLGLQSIAVAFKEGLSASRFVEYDKRIKKLFLLFTEWKLSLRVRENKQMLVEEILSGIEIIQNDLQREAEIKREILFLPYKASMWDSLESIWLAAKEDPTCECYVMPIPYFDRKPDKSFGKMHYEGNMLPPYVPIVRYSEYDISQRKPDVVYIHNPYDEFNYVTSVHPRYYSYELKKHTNMLVYVPYFLVGKTWPEEQAEKSCYYHIDKMVVQKNKMEIEPMLDGDLIHAGKKYMDDFVPQEKLLPLGSPKIDRVFFCEKHKEIPFAWQARMQGKKVILYNVSLSKVLNFGEKMMRKIQYVFDCFRGRSDVVLLWRPHPLLESTLKLMNLDLYEMYKCIEAQFFSEDIGILDKTSDINMAVAIADAYLGESSSSVVNLFGIAGKPIFFTDDMTLWETPNEEEMASVCFNFMAEEDGFVYFIAEEYNAFCEMQIFSGEITPLVKFEDFPINGDLYSYFIKVEDKWYFSPSRAKNICEYDLQTKKCKMIPIDNPLEAGNFGRIIPYKNYLFIVPWRYPAILRYDRITGECRYYKECMQELIQFRDAKHEEFFGWGCVRENCILLPVLLTNKIMEFNMDTGAYVFYDLPGNNMDCMIMLEGENDEYWLIPWKMTCVRRWTYKKNACEFYDEYPADYRCQQNWYNGETYRFSGAIKENGGIWLFPYYGNMVLKLDIASGKIEKADIALPYEIEERKSLFYLQQNNFFNARAYGDNQIIALSSYDRSLVILDTLTKSCQLQHCRLSANQVKMLSTSLKNSFAQITEEVPYAMTENHYWRNISSFIEYVIAETHDEKAQKDAYGKNIENADGTCGEKVHAYIMEQIRK